MIRLPGTITIAAVGRLRTPHWEAAQTDYLARLRRYSRVELVEVRDEVGGHLPDEVAITREGEALLDAVRDIPWVIALNTKGKQAGSVQFAHYLRQKVEVYRDVGFVIGGPLGLAPAALERADEQLSLSRLTLPHELARVVLLEQLYRAATILSGEPYHK
ncbi:MAG: 23S rRNA (pseudouridine(1915)-N(3))-methyltransferase RlmH [Anaerolineae bacterium]